MTPSRSPAHLALIRSLPCVIRICRSRFTVPMHTSGSRGMAQKRSDFETVPGCDPHHREQHRIGWPAFIAKYELDIPALIAALNVKPHISRCDDPQPMYWMAYQGETYQLNRVDHGGLKLALRLAQGHRRDWLIENVLRPANPLGPGVAEEFRNDWAMER
jgi:hypothetical protein